MKLDSQTKLFRAAIHEKHSFEDCGYETVGRDFDNDDIWYSLRHPKNGNRVIIYIFQGGVDIWKNDTLIKTIR